jgi:hypothetical protein
MLATTTATSQKIKPSFPMRSHIDQVQTYDAGIGFGNSLSGAGQAYKQLISSRPEATSGRGHQSTSDFDEARKQKPEMSSISLSPRVPEPEAWSYSKLESIQLKPRDDGPALPKTTSNNVNFNNTSASTTTINSSHRMSSKNTLQFSGVGTGAIAAAGLRANRVEV